MNFVKPKNLPSLMVAPNGARPTKKDHPELPISVAEIVKTGKACYEAGADAIHFHTRDKDGKHVLDSGLCKEILNELNTTVPKMHFQITTEAIGIYTPDQMRKLALEVMPPGISISIREMIPSGKITSEDIEFYKSLTEAGTKIQHICYKTEDIDLLTNLLDDSKITKANTWCMFVIGHYSGSVSNPKNILSFIEKSKSNNFYPDWAVCAFGKEEISCLRTAIKLGGKIRVGFENSFLMPDGSIAPNNETKVKLANFLLSENL